MEVTTWNWQWSGVFPHSNSEEETNVITWTNCVALA